MKKSSIFFTLFFALLIAFLTACAGGSVNKGSKSLKPMEMVFVKGGCYMMGDIFGDGEPDEKPVHEVCVSDFNISRFEVTVRQWQEVMGNNPNVEPCVSDVPECPAGSVSWDDAQEYIKKLNARSGRSYRLPTEAEWEYAARSMGKDHKWPGTNKIEEVNDLGWNYNNLYKMSPVGMLKPNEIGLYDMAGNVYEWCQDWYGETYYSDSVKNDPAGPATGEKHVVRGGGFYDGELPLRTVKRHGDFHDMRDAAYGFRLVLPVPAVAQ